MKSFQVSVNQKGLRIDKFLAEYLEGFSRSQINKKIENGLVSANEETITNKYKTKEGDRIKVDLSPIEPEAIPKFDYDLDKVYEDESLLVINKPVGMTSVIGNGQSEFTLQNALLHLDEQFKQIERCGICHRLDKDTSGLIIVAKSQAVFEKMQTEFKKRRVKKKYICFVHGRPPSKGEINFPISRHAKNRIKMIVSKDGKEALTYFTIKRMYKNFSLLEVEISTGRTHQIRLHLSHLGFPVVGERLYKQKVKFSLMDNSLREPINKLKNQLLHSSELTFTHPVTKETMTFHTDIPEQFQNIVDLVEQKDSI